MMYFKCVSVILYMMITFINCLNENLFIQELSRESQIDNNTPVCRFRNYIDLYPSNDLWRYLTGAYCYFYTPDRRRNTILEINISSEILHTVVNGTRVYFDFTNKTYVDLIRPSFKTERFLNLWIECSQLAVDCCTNYLNESNVFPTEEYPCPALWDAWDCWPATRAGDTAYRSCPHHYSEGGVCEMQSEKYCLENGTWNHHTNYNSCAEAPVFRRRNNFHVLVLIISTVITFPAILIFIVFMRNQKNLRIDLNRNLLIAIVLKNILRIISTEVIILGGLKSDSESNNVMDNNSVECRILTFFVSVATTSIFTCMFIIALYLHKTIARIFSTDVKVYLFYSIFTVFTVIPPLIWAIVMGATGQENCWIVDTEGYQWITDSYKYGTLLVNLILLLDIVRVIWMKRFTLSSKQTKTAVKATLVLIPLFGLPLLITSQRNLFDHRNCLAGDIYYYIAYSVEALQGVVVAFLFCYLSVEIHTEIRKFYRKFVIFMNSNYGTNFKVPPQGRTTIMTNLKTSTDSGHISKDHLHENKGNAQIYMSANNVATVLNSGEVKK